MAYSKIKIIKHNKELAFDEFVPKVTKIVIEHDFDFDDDHSSHFEVCKYLEEFEVLNEESGFFTKDGILYFENGRFPKSVEHPEKNIISMCFDGMEYKECDRKGVYLVAVPPAYPSPELVIPDGVIGICSSAFAGTGLCSIKIPDSVRIIAMAAFAHVDNLQELMVPKHQMDALGVDHNNVSNDVELKYNDGSKLTKEDEEDWRLILSGKCPKNYSKPKMKLYFESPF